MFAIEEVLSMKPQLRFIKDDVCGVVRSLKEIDEDYFLVFNVVHERYEVHNLKNVINTFCISQKNLDGNLVHRINKSMVAYHGDEVMTIDDWNRRREERDERKFRSNLEYAARYSRSAIRRGVERDETHPDYNYMHIMPEIKRKGGANNDRSST